MLSTDPNEKAVRLGDGGLQQPVIPLGPVLARYLKNVSLAASTPSVRGQTTLKVTVALDGWWLLSPG
jgi:hypothetical protein